MTDFEITTLAFFGSGIFAALALLVILARVDHNRSKSRHMPDDE